MIETGVGNDWSSSAPRARENDTRGGVPLAGGGFGRSSSGASPTLYRVQDKEGRGPYRPGFSHRWLDRKPNYAKRPAIQDDLTCLEFRYLDGFYGCAAKSIDQLRDWFSPGESTRLARFGYRVITFCPDEVVAETEYQVVFWSRSPLAKVGTPLSWAILTSTNPRRSAVQPHGCCSSPARGSDTRANSAPPVPSRRGLF